MQVPSRSTRSKVQIAQAERAEPRHILRRRVTGKPEVVDIMQRPDKQIGLRWMHQVAGRMRLESLRL
jgi:hypothetical protein